MSPQHETSGHLFGGYICSYDLHTDWIYTLAWSPDGKLIASAGRDQVIRIWHAENGIHYTKRRASESQINSIAWSPNGQYMAVAGKDKMVSVYVVASGLPRACFKEHKQAVNIVAWSPDGQFLASGDDDAMIYIWNINERKLEKVYDEHFTPDIRRRGGVHALAWSPDGTLIASSAADGVIHVWRVANRENVKFYKEHTQKVNSIAWSLNSEYIVSVDTNIHIWEVNTEKLIWKLIQREQQSESLPPTWLCEGIDHRIEDGDVEEDQDTTIDDIPSPDRTNRVSGDTVEEIQQTSPSKKRPRFMLFSLLISKINQWTGREDTDTASRSVTVVAWDRESKSVAFATRKWVYVFNRKMGIVYPPYEDHEDWVRTVAWSPDGTRIASAGDDKIVRVWEPIVPHQDPNDTPDI